MFYYVLVVLLVSVADQDEGKYLMYGDIYCNLCK